MDLLRRCIVHKVLTNVCLGLALAAGGLGADLASEFANPPRSSWPWAFVYWMEGNVTKEGITADLEAMEAQGIEGYMFMDVALGNPVGPHRYLSESWREHFQHLLAESARLGLKVNLSNGPGWAGSGGPWVRPEQATQKVVTSETVVTGPSRGPVTLPRPEGIRHGHYRDIAVLAYPGAGDRPVVRIPEFDSTKSFAGDRDFAKVVPWPRFIPTSPDWPVVPPDQRVASAQALDLSTRLEPDGTLRWDAPPGSWLVLRFGHTVANGQGRSAQPEAQGLETDKLSRAAVDSHLDSMFDRLVAEAGPQAGRAIVSAHIDSWESGSGNWTAGFREEFRRRRGYDLLPFLPTLNGVVVDSREVSERFLWDYRETVAEMILDHYAGYMREHARRRGLQLTIEAYDGTVDDLRYAGRADEPMTEYWQRTIYSGLPLCDLTDAMASAAHVYGRRVVGSEAFTAMRGDFLDHPALLKPLADWSLCAGVNRIYFSQWVMQPWPRVTPGVSFGDFGTVFHRALTWWEMSRPWHEYLARCQHLLREGRFVADVLFVTAEGAPLRFTPPVPADIRGGLPDRPGHNFDGCPPELILDPATRVENGEVVLPSGMRYRLLVLPSYNAEGRPVVQLLTQPDYFYKPAPLPKVETMTPALLRRVKELVEAGATVLGTRPVKSPSLVGYPQCDDEIARLADSVWGAGAGRAGRGERRIGKGRVVWGTTPDGVLAGQGVPPDFAPDAALHGRVNYIHRRLDDGTDLYFVMNKDSEPVEGTISFRVAGKAPAFWRPQTGAVDPGVAFIQEGGVTRVPLQLEANESVFVVFTPSRLASAVESVTRNGAPIWPMKAMTPVVADEFVLAAWVRPSPDISLPIGNIPLPLPVPGGWEYPGGVPATPGLGYQTFTTLGRARRGFAAGSNGVVVFQYGDNGGVQPLLAYDAPVANGTHVGVTYRDRVPKVYLDGRLMATGPVNRFPDRVDHDWADTRVVAGDIAPAKVFDQMRGAGKAVPAAYPQARSAHFPVIDLTRGIAWAPGRYELRTTGGETRRIEVDLPAPQELAGPWEVAFDPKWGGPDRAEFPQLTDWIAHPDPRIRFYSGTATYRKTFNWARTARADGTERVSLDLGEVSVISAVMLNGRNLDVLWKPPYRIDVTADLAAGENRLEIRVANVWTNRMIGDEQLPEDSKRDATGLLLDWPQWLRDGQPSPTGRHTFVTRRVWKAGDALIKSGLVGPVRLVTGRRLVAPDGLAAPR